MNHLNVIMMLSCVWLKMVVTSSDHEEEKIELMRKECRDSSGVDVTLVENLKKRQLGNDEKLAEYLFCDYKKSGILNEDAEYLKDGLRIKLEVKHDKKIADKIIEACANEKYSSGTEASMRLIKCYFENAPAE